MTLSLPDVTLVALDTANIDLTLLAMYRSMERCTFGDVVLIASRPVSAPFRTVLIEPFADKHAVGAFFVQKLMQHIHTPLFLSIQYDGYVVDASAWRSEFLSYDYIGAKWAWHTDGKNVGNSGFCLMSKKLLDVWGSTLVNPAHESSDDHLCRTLRSHLELKYGIRFAPEAVADLFAYENSLPRQPTFGFHGLFNMYRHLDDVEMAHMAGQLADYLLPSTCYAKIITEFYLMRKFVPLRAFYSRLRTKLSVEETHSHFTKTFNETFAHELIAVGENLIGNGPLTAALTIGTDIKQNNEDIDPRGRLFPWER
jgi:hypothetical protein